LQFFEETIMEAASRRQWPKIGGALSISVNYGLWVRTLQSVLGQLGLDAAETEAMMGGNAAAFVSARHAAQGDSRLRKSTN
jgi:hypothetical protein